MLVWPLVRRGTGGPSVNTLEATMLMNKKDSLVLDVREAGEFAQGHILNARNIPLDRARDAGEGDRALQGEAGHRLLRDRQPRRGRPRACCASTGFTNVVNLSGGIAAWRQAGLPTEK